MTGRAFNFIRSSFRRVLIVSIMTMSFEMTYITTPACPEDYTPTEYEIKAAFLYNFSRFVEYPHDFLSSRGSLNLCILGDDPFGPAANIIMDETAEDERKISINRIKTSKELSGCHMLFVSSSEKNNVAKIMESLAGMHILTIGDTVGFAQKGVIINFFLERNKVRFEINIHAANRAGLRISSKLLNLARIVHD
jgi:YfiR/HmsC-like